MKLGSKIGIFLFVAALSAVAKKYPNECGPRKTKKVGNKKIDVVTECVYGSKSISEYYNGKLNGKTTTFYENGRIKDIQFYKDDKNHGLVQIFDSLGNVTGIEHFHHGKQVGEIRRWHRPDQLSEVIQYDSLGRKNGLWQAWWPDGKLIHESHYVANICTLTTEYYRNGRKRYYEHLPLKESVGITSEKLIDGESWSWSGKPIAKVVSGTGTLITLPRDFEDRTTPWAGYRAEYKDSIVVKLTELDSAAIEKYR